MSKRVLLVEDDLQMQALIIDYLKDYGFATTAFDNPKDVLDQLLKARKGQEIETRKIKIKKIKNKDE